jgi:hypothetical protein
MAKPKARSVVQTDDDALYYERCAGIDVHKKLLVVCLRIGRRTESREFGTTTGEIREIVAWLKANGCQMAAMESTGSYWKPLYNIFEQEQLQAMVCNAYHISRTCLDARLTGTMRFGSRSALHRGCSNQVLSPDMSSVSFAT